MSVASVGFKSSVANKGEILQNNRNVQQEKQIIILNKKSEGNDTMLLIGKAAGATVVTGAALAIVSKKTDLLKPKGKGFIQDAKGQLEKIGLKIADKSIAIYNTIRQKVKSN